MPKAAITRLLTVLLPGLAVLALTPAANTYSRVTWLGPDGAVITGCSMDRVE